MRLVFGTQNMTEGPVTEALRDCDIWVGQEIDKRLVRKGIKDSHRAYFPKRDKHQCIVWDNDLIKVTRRGWDICHRSGEAENWPFGSPARGIIWIKAEFRDRPALDPFLVFGLWNLNSWYPKKPDKHTAKRKQIVLERSIPTLERRIRLADAQGRKVLGGGDGNSLKWNGKLTHVRQVWPKGLDRLWASPEYEELDCWDGPKTGVGNQMRHASRIASIQVPTN